MVTTCKFILVSTLETLIPKSQLVRLWCNFCSQWNAQILCRNSKANLSVWSFNPLHVVNEIYHSYMNASQILMVSKNSFCAVSGSLEWGILFHPYRKCNKMRLCFPESSTCYWLMKEPMGLMKDNVLAAFCDMFWFL